MSPNRGTKSSVAVAVFEGRVEDGGDETRVLAVLRPRDDEELPDVWGLPAATLRAGEGPAEAVRRAGREKLGVELRVGQVLQEGAAARPGYDLRMTLFAAEIARGRPSVPQGVPGVTQYRAWEWVRPDRLSEAARRGSLCSRLLLAHLKGGRFTTEDQ